jgi:phosphoserine phosphatase RsbU/P
MDKPPNATILIVDDDRNNLRVLQIRLKAEGYTVLTATSGQEALDQVEENVPDLILLDIQMPQMDGFQVCGRIRQHESMRFIPIVMVTALSDSQDRIRAIEAGADDFISKPFDYLEIRARVRSLLRIKEYHDALEEHNARLERELQMAGEIQAILIPRVDTLSGFKVAPCYLPEIAVGGDFFDLWEMAPGRLGVFISDVMGHGVPAAFVTVFIKTVVEELRRQIDDPGKLLEMLNARFTRLLSSQLFMFATAFYAVIDLPHGTISCANAGHPSPFLLQYQGEAIHELVENREAGKGLGLSPNNAYQTYHYPFGRSSRIFLYTDGAYEVKNPQGEEFGINRLKNVLAEQMAQSTPVLVEQVLNSINLFNAGHPKDDDVTLVAVYVDGQEESPKA